MTIQALRAAQITILVQRPLGELGPSHAGNGAQQLRALGAFGILLQISSQGVGAVRPQRNLQLLGFGSLDFLRNVRRHGDRRLRPRAGAGQANDGFERCIFVRPLRVFRNQANLFCNQRKHVVDRNRLLQVAQERLRERAVFPRAVCRDRAGIGRVGDEDAAAGLTRIEAGTDRRRETGRAAPSTLRKVLEQRRVVAAGVEKHDLGAGTDAVDEIIDLQPRKLDVRLGMGNVDVGWQKVIFAVQLCPMACVEHESDVRLVGLGCELADFAPQIPLGCIEQESSAVPHLAESLCDRLGVVRRIGKFREIGVAAVADDESDADIPREHERRFAVARRRPSRIGCVRLLAARERSENLACQPVLGNVKFAKRYFPDVELRDQRILFPVKPFDQRSCRFGQHCIRGYIRRSASLYDFYGEIAEGPVLGIEPRRTCQHLRRGLFRPQRNLVVQRIKNAISPKL